jgi:hypothetical protein
MNGAKINDSLCVSRHEFGTAKYVNEYNLYLHRRYSLNVTPSR